MKCVLAYTTQPGGRQQVTATLTSDRADDPPLTMLATDSLRVVAPGQAGVSTAIYSLSQVDISNTQEFFRKTLRKALQYYRKTIAPVEGTTTYEGL